MSRRSSRKSTSLATYAESDDESKPTIGRSPSKKRVLKVVVQQEEEGLEVEEDNLEVDEKIGKGKQSLRVEKAVTAVKKDSLSTRKVKAVVDIDVSPVVNGGAATAVQVKKVSAKRKTEVKDEDEGAGVDVDAEKVKKKRKTKEEKEAEAMPLAARTSVQTLKKAMYIGAHVSGAGGVQNSISNSLHIGGNAFALFLKSQRKWTSPPLAPDARKQFQAFCKEHKYDAAKHILPHGSYLVNLAQAEPEKAEQAYSCFLDDLQRCEALGIKLYNFHPGNTNANPRPEAIARIAANLNKAHKATSTVVTVLENMAGAGNVIGCSFEDLRDIIALVEDKSRVGVCIDTCHAFAAGYDLRSPEAFKETMDKFASIVGNEYLRALHLNDSKTPLSSRRDLHANIGTGFLGLRAFHNVVNYAPFQDLPMVLETPTDRKGPTGKVEEDKSVWAAEIKLLEGLIGVDPDTEVFRAEEVRLQAVGEEERRKFQGQVDKKAQKTIDSMFKGKGKGGKKKKDEEEESDGGCSHE